MPITIGSPTTASLSTAASTAQVIVGQIAAGVIGAQFAIALVTSDDNGTVFKTVSGGKFTKDMAKSGTDSVTVGDKAITFADFVTAAALFGEKYFAESLEKKSPPAPTPAPEPAPAEAEQGG